MVPIIPALSNTACCDALQLVQRSWSKAAKLVHQLAHAVAVAHCVLVSSLLAVVSLAVAKCLACPRLGLVRLHSSGMQNMPGVGLLLQTSQCV